MTARLVALDVDGTLLSFSGELSDAVRSAVAAVREAGHHVVLSTGRSVHGTVPVAAELGIETGWAICSNGSVTVRLDPDLPGGYEVDQVITFDPAPALRLLRAELPDAHLAVEEVGVGFRLNKLFPDGELTGRLEIVEPEDLESREVTRLIVRSPGDASTDFHERVAAMGLSDVSYAIGYTAWIDVAPPGVTKASGLERLRGVLGVPQELTVAVGDGRNDVDMLRWAGRGVAMGHAEPEVQACADEVTGSIDEDGVAAVLRSLL